MVHCHKSNREFCLHKRQPLFRWTVQRVNFEIAHDRAPLLSLVSSSQLIR